MDFDEISDEEIEEMLGERPWLLADERMRGTFRGIYRVARQMLEGGYSAERIRALMAEAMWQARMQYGAEPSRWVMRKDNGELN